MSTQERDPLEYFDLPVHSGDAFCGFEDLKQSSSHRRQTLIKLKRWGYEEWICNGDYCGKKLVVYDGTHTSFHYHKIKDEHFLVLSGHMTIYVGNTEGKVTSIEQLNSGDTYHVPPGVVHCIAASGGELSFVEFSSHHSDEDSFRVKLCYPGGING